MKILLTAHGTLASSLLKSVHMILGETDERIQAVDFDANDSLQALQKRIEAQLDTAGTYIFCDLKGGTPFNASYRLASEHPIRIICGMNLAMLLECIMAFYQDENSDIIELALTSGKQAIEGFTFDGK